MGQLLYGSPPEVIEFDDRILVHLDMVIIAKLRRDEKFTLTWNDCSGGDRRCTIWLHPAIPLQFRFDSLEPQKINRGWLEHLMNTANTGAGLQIVPEPKQAEEQAVA